MVSRALIVDCRNLCVLLGREDHHENDGAKKLIARIPTTLTGIATCTRRLCFDQPKEVFTPERLVPPLPV
jgi:hypothetical protein